MCGQQTHPVIDSFVLYNYPLSQRIVTTLCEQFPNPGFSSLHTLNLGNTGISTDQLTSLLASLQSSPSHLVTLQIDSLSSLHGNLGDWKLFPNAFASLRELCVDSDQLTTEGIRPLLELIHGDHLSEIRTLTLRENRLDDAGCMELIQGIHSHCKRIRSLGLSLNSFSDSFLKELSLLFKKNYLPSLGEIQLLSSSVPSRYVSEAGLAFCRECASLNRDLAQYGVFQRVAGDEEE
ncbi:hypothetical protein WA538_000251 [Blastocystis sp. DL]